MLSWFLLTSLPWAFSLWWADLRSQIKLRCSLFPLDILYNNSNKMSWWQKCSVTDYLLTSCLVMICPVTKCLVIDCPTTIEMNQRFGINPLFFIITLHPCMNRIIMLNSGMYCRLSLSHLMCTVFCSSMKWMAYVWEFLIPFGKCIFISAAS